MRSALVFGDLSLDVVSNLTEAPPSSPFGGHDVTLVGEPRMLLGGSAVLFARAASALVEPHIIGCVGRDFSGDVLKTLVTAESYRSSIHRTDEAPTAVINVIYDDNGDRLMVRSNHNANKYLDVSPSELLPDGRVDEYCLLFVSGYLLTVPDAPTVGTLRNYCESFRTAGIPIILDCVPHEFKEHAGTLATVSKLIGPLDAVVMELRTAVGLGYADSDECVLDGLAQAADSLSNEVEVAIIQARSGPLTYSQAVRQHGQTAILHYPCEPTNMLGVGDRLLCDAIVRTKLIR